MRGGCLLTLLGLPAAAVMTAAWIWTGSILASVLLVVVPAMAFAQVKALQDEMPPRDVIYRSSMASHVIFGGLALWVGIDRFGLAELGLSPLPGATDVLWALAVLAAVLGANVVLHFITEAMGMEASEVLKRLVPRTREDRRTFALMSVTAGVGEEIVYRGFLFLILVAAGLSVPGALVLQALAFGMVHAYQGPVGVTATALLGLLFGLSFVLLGTLWPAILAHVAVDWVVGLMLTDYFFGPEEEPTSRPGVDDPPPPEPEPTPTDSP